MLIDSLIGKPGQGMEHKPQTKEKTEAQENFKKFAKVTTAHGIKYAVAEDSGTVRRVIWLTAVLAACGVLGFQLIIFVIDYFNYPFKTVTKVSPQTSIPFPTVTICDLNHLNAKKVNNTKEVKEIFRITESNFWMDFVTMNITEMRQREPYKTILETDYKTLIRQANPTIDETLQYCAWGGEPMDCKSIAEYTFTPIGRCFMLNSNTSDMKIATRAGSKGGLFLVMSVDPSGYTSSENMAAGLKVLLHPASDYPDMYSKGLLISPGFAYDIAFQKNSFRLLPYPYKALGDDYCTENTTVHGSHTKGYSQSTCILHTAKRITGEKCGCQYNCTVDQYLTCYRPEFASIYAKGTKSNQFNCPYSCFSETYSPIISKAFYPFPDAQEALAKMDPNVNVSEIRNSYVVLNLYFDDFIVRESEHIPEYDSLSIMGVIGGNMGLFMGASILTVAELLEFILIICIRIGRKLGCRLGSKVADTRNEPHDRSETSSTTTMVSTLSPSEKGGRGSSPRSIRVKSPQSLCTDPLSKDDWSSFQSGL